MENENIKKKDTSKGKIILFVIGVLVGAVISTVAFFVCVKVLGVSGNNGNSSSQQMQGGTPPEMPSGSNSGNGQGGIPPEMPGNGSSNSNNNNNNNN